MYYYKDVGGGQSAALVYILIGIAFVKFCGIIHSLESTSSLIDI